MNTKFWIKIRKCRYKKSGNIPLTVLSNIVFAVEIILCVIVLIERFTANSEAAANLILYLTLAVGYLWVLCEAIYFLQKSKTLKSPMIHHNYVKRSVMSIAAVAVVVIALVFLAVSRGKIYSAENKAGLYIWYIAMIGLAWTDGYYINSVLLFGEDCYYSGKYKVRFNDVRQVKILSEHRVDIHYSLYFVEIYGENGIMGMDKLFSEEYDFLMSRIPSENTAQTGV